MFNTSQVFAICLNPPVCIIPAPDQNFYLEEDQLAEALSAPLPAGISLPPLPSLDPADFEKIYTWFIA